MTDEKQTQEQADEEMINQGFQELLDSYLATKHRKKVEIITKAFNFAKQAHKGVKRRSGEPYIMHPIAVAKIVCTEIGLGSTSICSALLHDVVEDTDYTVEDIENLFGPKIAQIVDGLTKISGGIFGDRIAAFGDDTLDQGAAIAGVAVHDDHIAPLRLIACAPDDEFIAVFQRRHHRLAVHLNDTEEKGKHQHQHQRRRNKRFVPFQQALTTDSRL